MSAQFILASTSPEAVVTALKEAGPLCEIFPMGEARIGLSVPNKVVDQIGMDEILKRIRGFSHYDLFAGRWSGQPPESA
jgi:hypothetical protein